MSSFVYFAYGSNMLTARLRERCPSAAPIGTGWATGYVVAYDKEGRDGSGKANLRRDQRVEAATHGVLFRIALHERAALDRAEARYDRIDDFTVRADSSDAPILVSVYIAPAHACRQDLRPFDWYVALIQAGAREHNLCNVYIGELCAIPTGTDNDAERVARMHQLQKTKYG